MWRLDYRPVVVLDEGMSLFQAWLGMSRGAAVVLRRRMGNALFHAAASSAEDWCDGGMSFET